MTSTFAAEVYQNEYLPAGTREVHAIMTVTAAAANDAVRAQGERTFGVLCDVSGSMEGSKIEAAKEAMGTLVQMLPGSCHFFLIAGSDHAQLISPVQRADAAGRAKALAAIEKVRAFGGTRISNWLRLAGEQFQGRPAGLHQVLLLTDGQNDADDQRALEETLQASEGVFQCDCRGVGTDWQVQQLRQIAEKLLGTVDLIPSPQQIEADFRGMLERAMAKTVSDVSLRLWTPRPAHVRFVKEVSPSIHDLTDRARELGPQLREYPTGAWARGECRDFHLCIEVPAGSVGDEMLAGRASLVVTTAGLEDKVAEAKILAIWTEDETRSARIDCAVAHYTNQAELAQSIQEGMDARARGDLHQATTMLGRAVKLAFESGNEATAKLLGRVVDVEDARTGTVRLRAGSSKEDSMALETRSTKTTRLPRSPS